MKALETEYKGFRFRSRLEARWAVFMDAMGVRYEYEPEAYDLDGLFYLPDFWLPQMKAYLEIKPECPTEEEAAKAARLAKHTGADVFILRGAPEVPDFCCYGDGPYQAEVFSWLEDGLWDCCYFWCECPTCHRCELQFDGRAERIKCGCRKEEILNYDSPKLRAAYARAKGYRFEPGASNVI